MDELSGLLDRIQREAWELEMHRILWGELPPRILEGEEKARACAILGGDNIDPDKVVVRALDGGGFDITPTAVHERMEAEKARKQEWYNKVNEEEKP